jgi:tRNA(Ile2) C34 agmatinyltransferase TiaS
MMTVGVVGVLLVVVVLVSWAAAGSLRPPAVLRVRSCHRCGATFTTAGRGATAPCPRCHEG